MPPRNNRGKVASPQGSSQPKFDPSAWLLRRVTDVDDDTVASQHDLRQKVCTIGRRDTNTIVLTSRQFRKLVSRRHAQLVWGPTADEWTIEDLESTNGVLVNHVKVKKCRLAEGDVVSFVRASGKNFGEVLHDRRSQFEYVLERRHPPISESSQAENSFEVVDIDTFPSGGDGNAAGSSSGDEMTQVLIGVPDADAPTPPRTPSAGLADAFGTSSVDNRSRRRGSAKRKKSATTDASAVVDDGEFKSETHKKSRTTVSGDEVNRHEAAGAATSTAERAPLTPWGTITSWFAWFGNLFSGGSNS